ncbi:MAG TPA: hypothetical protein VKP13_09575 [Nitrospira sp.]|nr:hypothetical protein [Nitrospira sp.]
MSVNKISNPGFGPGSALGTPVTYGIAASSTVTITAGQYQVLIPLTAGSLIAGVSNSNGITATYTIIPGSGYGYFMADGGAVQGINTTTTVSMVFIQY